MNVLTGTSGFSFDEWQGRFYPKGLASEERLAHYASRLRSVEINNTFYQMPKAALLERWRDTVPDHFRFAIKAPRRFTHGQRLQIPSESLGYFLTALSALGNKLGPVLFQLPPFLRKDAPLLADFLERLPAGLKWAFEFRHASWFSEEILALLASKNAALCLGDSDERGTSAPFVATADFGYLRLRSPSYDENALRTWSQRILAERWQNTFVYLKHEVLGPDYALFLAAAAAGAPEPPLLLEQSAAADTGVNAEVPKPPKKGLARAKPRTPAPEVRAARRKKVG